MTSEHPQRRGPNTWLLEELKQNNVAHEPVIVDAEIVTAQPPLPGPAPKPKDSTEQDTAEQGTELRGVQARIVDNMQASLSVPTATSFRNVAAKMLESNRLRLNGYLRRTNQGKISFSHLIAWAIVRAIADHVPAMNSTFSEDQNGKPRVIRHDNINLGLAIDVKKSDGTRSLVVPTIRGCDKMTFAQFVAAYNDLVARGRANKLTLDDFGDVTVSITNPGGIGTVQSVPRLMSGQAVIAGIGAIGLPAEWQAADERTIAELGISTVVTITSTYDHRVIQGAESGEFLAAVNALLLGEHDFYRDTFESLGVPYKAIAFAHDRAITTRDDHMEKQVAVSQCLNMHRVRGHLIADLDPLNVRTADPDLDVDPETYGLTIWDLDREFLHTDYAASGLAKPRKATFRKLLGEMRDAYCRTIGVDFMHIQNPIEKRWIQQTVEGYDHKVSNADKRWILSRLAAAEELEQFLDRKYPGTKRFGIEGGESAIPILNTIIDQAADAELAEVMVGMAHRGRLNVLVNVVGKRFKQLFREFEVGIDEDSVQGTGDVKYHLGMNSIYKARSGKKIPLRLAANPSHLEAVDPVVVGMARAMGDRLDPTQKPTEASNNAVNGAAISNSDRGFGSGTAAASDATNFAVLPLLIHGDAAFAGQGVVAETLNLSQIPGFAVGGTIHLVINNQVGFTTTAEQQRSSTYCTDVARMIQAPIFHVNGDDPEACYWVAQLAFMYRQKFCKDVVIDLWCYRRRGHNEGDDPSYTQPLMYKVIDEIPSTRQKYADRLVDSGVATEEEINQHSQSYRDDLQSALETMRRGAPPKDLRAAAPPPAVGVLPPIDTSIPRSKVDEIYSALTALPEGFTLHPKLARQFERREKLYRAGTIDWAMAEAMAWGSLLNEGTSIRLSGQDSRRGTFSHRHSTLVDNVTGKEFRPLDTLISSAGPSDTPARYMVYDSLLSEYAALGFEYGYSVLSTDSLVMWEAQFGDFVNGAQIVIDQFIVSAEDKWQQSSGLVMLLPHGYEGQGPEHSSARIERILAACAEDNIQVCNPTTAAQYFHLLRRQTKLERPKPLVLFTPKSLLRSRNAHCPIERICTGSFEEILDDTSIAPADKAEVTHIVLATGKVAYDMISRRDDLTAKHIAVIRIEQLFPWPGDQLEVLFKQYPNTTELTWLQEEPENMGAWTFVRGRLIDRFGPCFKLGCVSRPASGSPATGSASIHAQEQADLLNKVVAIQS